MPHQVIFYDKGAQQGEIYHLNGGHLANHRGHNGWRSSWSQVRLDKSPVFQITFF